MPYVQRDGNGLIKTVAEPPQYEAHEWDDPPETWVPIAVEEVPEDHPDLVAFRERLKPQPAADPLQAQLDAIKAVLIEKTGITSEQFEARVAETKIEAEKQ